LQMGRVLAYARKWYLVGAPETLYLVAVHFLGASPPLRAAQHDHRPACPVGLAAGASLLLNAANLKHAVLERPSHLLMHYIDVFPFYEIGCPPITLEEVLQLFV